MKAAASSSSGSGSANKRGRGRSSGGGGGGGRKGGQQPQQKSDSGNGKVRGNAGQIMEKYLTMAREAQASGDRVLAENYFQHADHYYRIMSGQVNGSGKRGKGRQAIPEPPVAHNVSESEGGARGGDGQDAGEAGGEE